MKLIQTQQWPNQLVLTGILAGLLVIAAIIVLYSIARCAMGREPGSNIFRANGSDDAAVDDDDWSDTGMSAKLI